MTQVGGMRMGGSAKMEGIYVYIQMIHFMYRIVKQLLVLSHFSHVQLFVTPWSIAHQVPLFMGILRQEYWSELPFPSPGDLPNPGNLPNQGSNPGLQHCRWILYQLSHEGSPVRFMLKILRVRLGFNLM